MGEFNLHKVKRQVRKEAWYDKPGEKPTYNPFKRPRATPWSESTTPKLLSERQRLSEPIVTSKPTEFFKPEIVSLSTTAISRPPNAEFTARGPFLRRANKLEQFEDVLDVLSIASILPHPKFTLANQLQRTILNSWLNLLLLLVPVGFVLNYLHVSPIAVFFVNLAAVIPVSGLFSNAIDEVQLRIGIIPGILVYMTFGNAAVLVTSVFLLRSGQVETLKTSLVGGVLTINLFNIGVAFSAGGFWRAEQYFNPSVAQSMTGLLLVTVTAFLIPTASSLIKGTAVVKITQQSRGAAVILIVVYGLYLYFEFSTHKSMFMEKSQKAPFLLGKYELPVKDGVQKSLAMAGAVGAAVGRVNGRDIENHTGDHLMDTTASTADLEDEEGEPQLHILVCASILIIGTTILAFNTQFMTDSIQGLTEKAGVPRDFIGIVLLPILSNDLMAIQSAMKDKVDVTIQAAIGRSLQITLFIIPVLIIAAWGMGVETMNLSFDGFQVIALFASVLLVQNGISAGKSNWLIGAMFVLTYVMIGIAAWFQD